LKFIPFDKTFQSKNLRRIVKHAYENVEMYRRKWKEKGVVPEDIKVIDDLYKLPIITKDDIKRCTPDELFAKNYDLKDCYVVGTSGSTGSPLKIFVERGKILYDIASIWIWSIITREGFGKVVIEANACGIPAITVNEPDNAAKSLIKNGKNGKKNSLLLIQDENHFLKSFEPISSEGLGGIGPEGM
jgi:hypothetical protein